MAYQSFSNVSTTAPIERDKFLPRLNTTLSLVAGKLTDQVLVVWQSHQIHEYLLASDQRRQVWHCWLSTQNEIGDPQQAHHFLSQAKSRDILADVYGCCPPGLISALGKLGAQARQKEFYAALFGVLNRCGSLARHVHHLKQISDETIFALAAINDHPLSDRILRVLLKRSKPHRLAEVVWMVSRLTQLLNESEVERAILCGGNPARSVEKLIGKLPFPDRPFVGDPRLRPVTSSQDLRALGREFKNCLTEHSTWIDAVIEVQAGRTYFYRWDGDQPAILSFSRFGSLGWIPREFSVAGNDHPTEDTRRQVEQVLRQIPDVGPISMRGGYRF